MQDPRPGLLRSVLSDWSAPESIRVWLALEWENQQEMGVWETEVHGEEGVGGRSQRSPWPFLGPPSGPHRAHALALWPESPVFTSSRWYECSLLTEPQSHGLGPGADRALG